MRKFFRLASIISVLVGPVLTTGPTIASDGASDLMDQIKRNSTESSAAAKNPGAMKIKSFDRGDALRISGKALGRKVPDYKFTSADGEPVNFSDFAGKPVMVNFIYTSCMHTCPMIVENLEKSVKVARDALGDDSFKVITIGFDTKNDTVSRMKSYAGAHRIGDDNWLVLSADKETIQALTETLGFYYHKAPHGFDHLAQVTVVDELGVVYRQIYGIELPAPIVVEPLKQLVFGRKTNYTSFSGFKYQIKLFCTIYDPNSGHYKFDFSFIISLVVGLAILSGLATLFVRSWMSLKKRDGAA